MNRRAACSVFRLAALLLMAIVLAAQPRGAAAQLDYMDITPLGPQFPQWDGGDTCFCFADIDTDGHVDFLSIGDHGSPYVGTTQHGIMVYFGDGAGGWSIHMEGNFGYGGIAVGDVNSDGLLDVGYGMHHNYSATDLGDQLIEVALGDGTGTSWIPWDDGLATNGESWGMFATDFADFDADGDLDLVSGSFGSGNGVHVYRNNGDGSWTQTWARTGGNSQPQLCAGDVNGDGFPDIAASYEQGTIWLGDGEGGFTQADTGLPPGGGMGRGGVSLGDVDGDGCADLAFAQSGGVRVYLWRTDHWESASSGLPGSGGYEITQLRDMNTDGLLDVTALGDGTMSVWLGDGAGGEWTHGGGFYIGPAVDTAAFAAGGDVDHNGYPDLVLLQEEGSWPSYQNYLYVYRETSVPDQRFVLPQFPRGNEAFFLGAVQTIRWSAAQISDDPATVNIELSLSGPEGPWSLLALGIPDSGHWQWTVSGAPSDQAHLRLTLLQGWEAVTAISGAFRILPSDASGAVSGGSGVPGALPRLALAQNPVRDIARFQIAWREENSPGERGGDASWLLTVHEPSGRLVRRLEIDSWSVTWDLKNEAGHQVAAGVYLARLANTGDEAAGRALRVVVLR